MDSDLRKQKLDEISQEIEEMGDRLGKPIDEGIKETVVMFIANGLPTFESCEGHLDHGYPAPWVGVADPDEPEERFIGQNAAFEKVAEKYGITLEEAKTSKIDEAYWEALKECSQNGEALEFLEWRRKNQELMKKARRFLDEFYKNRKVPENIKLEISEAAEGTFRIRNGGADYGSTADEKLLEQYCAEMREFTEFLKKKFLGV